jgi:TonB-dependent siderophore receptor
MTTTAAIAVLAAGSTGSATDPPAAPDGPQAILLAQSDQRRRFEIPPQPLSRALALFGQQAGLQVAVDSAAIAGLSTAGVSGAMSVDDALGRLLAGTGLAWQYTSASAISIERPRQEGDGPLTLGPISVEGAASHFGDAPPEPGGFKADYQTSATRTPLTLRETPQSVSVVTQDLLEARQVQDLGQALETVAGVNQYSGPGPFGGKSPFGFDEVAIRGMGLSGLFDTRENGFISPTYFSQPDLAIYERVEVIKGPSSVLYGRGSAGGFVNRVRKTPQPELAAEVVAEVGSFDHYRGEADVTGPLFASEKVRARLVAAYQNAGSFVEHVEGERGLVAPSLEFDLTESTRLRLEGFYQADDFIPNPGFPLALDGNHFRAPRIDRSLFVGVPNKNENEWQVWSGSLQLDQELGDDWLATLRLNRSYQDSPVRIDSYGYAYGGLPSNGDLTLYSSAFEFKTDVWSGEFKLDGDLDLFERATDVTVGVDHYKINQSRTDRFATLGTANIYDENFNDFPLLPPDELGRDSQGDDQSTGVFAQLQVRPIERLGVLLGGRFDWADSSYVDNLADTTTEKDDQEFTWRAGLTFDVTDNIAVYGLYARSFSPTLFGIDAEGNILDPETGEIFEVGLKTEWLDDRLGVNAALFRIDRDNVPIPDPENRFFNISGGLQRSEGVELEVNGEPLPGWQVSFAGTVMSSEYVKQDDPFHGSRPLGVADWQVGLFTSYELQRGPLQGFGLGVGLFAIGDRGLDPSTDTNLDGYERVDLSAFYDRFEHFKIGLQVRNVLDETYVEGADRPGAYAQFGSPRAALLTARLIF